MTGAHASDGRFASVADTLSLTAQLHPDRCALSWRDRRWTYDEICRAVTVACRIFAELGGAGGGRVAIVGENHPAYVIAYYAVQFLGASSLEISPLESVETLTALIRRSGATALVSDHEDLLARLEGEIPCLSFDGLLASCDESAHRTPCRELPARREANDEASVIFTSGSTGLPKGVMLSQRNLCFVTEAIADYLDLRPEDRYGLVLPLAHSYGKSNLLSCFAAGATLLMLENFRDLESFLARLVSERCSILSLVPYHAALLLRRADLSGSKLCSLRALTFSSNALPESSVRGLRAALPWVKIFSMYGLTECATRACYLPPEHLDEKPGSVGGPLPGVELRVENEDGDEMRAGELGDLLIRGDNVMLGYLDEPELTAETLTDGWLRTGDLARLDGEGHLFISGRKKDIIKCAGERLSPAEIEAVLLSHPDVIEAAVTGKPDPLMGEAVWAFVVLAPGVQDLSGIRTHCARELSPHKIPRHFTRVEALPKTHTGKVRKHLLPGMVADG